MRYIELEDIKYDNIKEVLLSIRALLESLKIPQSRKKSNFQEAEKRTKEILDNYGFTADIDWYIGKKNEKPRTAFQVLNIRMKSLSFGGIGDLVRKRKNGKTQWLLIAKGGICV